MCNWTTSRHTLWAKLSSETNTAGQMEARRKRTGVGKGGGGGRKRLTQRFDERVDFLDHGQRFGVVSQVVQQHGVVVTVNAVFDVFQGVQVVQIQIDLKKTGGGTRLGTRSRRGRRTGHSPVCRRRPKTSGTCRWCTGRSRRTRRRPGSAAPWGRPVGSRRCAAGVPGTACSFSARTRPTPAGPSRVPGP